MSEKDDILAEYQISKLDPPDYEEIGRDVVRRTVEWATQVEQDKLWDSGSTRTFDTGATRDTEEGKLDYEGFLSPLVLRRYAEYMHKNRVQSDGSLRSADNWQKGIPRDVYMSSMWRHFMDVWTYHRGGDLNLNVTYGMHEEALCAVLFNAMGYLHELLKEKL